MSIESNPVVAPSIQIGGTAQPPAQAATAAAAVLPRVAPKAPQPAERVRQIAADMEKFVRESGRNLQFQVDESAGVVIVKIVDADSGELIRQVPSEEFLRVARNMRNHGADVSCILDECA